MFNFQDSLLSQALFLGALSECHIIISQTFHFVNPFFKIFFDFFKKIFFTQKCTISCGLSLFIYTSLSVTDKKQRQKCLCFLVGFNLSILRFLRGLCHFQCTDKFFAVDKQYNECRKNYRVTNQHIVVEKCHKNTQCNDCYRQDYQTF